MQGFSTPASYITFAKPSINIRKQTTKKTKKTLQIYDSAEETRAVKGNQTHDEPTSQFKEANWFGD